MNAHTSLNCQIANHAQRMSKPKNAYQAALAWEECVDLATKHKGKNSEDYRRNKLRAGMFFARAEELEETLNETPDPKGWKEP